MIVGLRILDTFEVTDAVELVKELRRRELLDFTLEEVKKACKKAWNGDFNWEDMIGDSECIEYILEELTNGNFDWDFSENNDDYFTINIIDKKDPFFKQGSISKGGKEVVNFT